MKIKIILLAILILTISIDSIGQRTKQAVSKKEVGFKNDEDFNVTTFPDKWKNESAIILCQKYDFSYVKFGMNSINFREVFRKRVFINDQKAKEELSIYYFIERNNSTENIGFIVEKADGKKINVDLKDAVDVGANEVSSAYRSYYSYNKKYKKIAIPNLEVGDIIDYYVYGTSTRSGSKEIKFASFSFSMAKSYPILKQKFYFNIDEGFKVNFRAYNGAPEIVRGKAGVNKYGKSKSDIKTYVIEDEDRDKLKDEIWKYDNLSEPWIKFQVYYAVGALAKKSTALIFRDKDLVNSPINKEKIKEKVLLNTSSMADPETRTISYVKKYAKKSKSHEETAELAYYYFRYYFFNSIKWSYNFNYEGGEFANMNYMSFTNSFSTILSRLKIPFKYVISADREVGSFDNVVFANDVTTGIKVGEKYFYFFSNVSTVDMLPSYIEGANAFEFYTDKSHKSQKITETVLPTTKYNNNAIYSTLKVSFDESIDTCIIVNVDSVVGPMKSSYNGLMLYKTNYLNEDKSLYDPIYIASKIKEAKRKSSSKSSGHKTKLSKKGKLKKAEEDRAKAQEDAELAKWRSDYVIDFFDGDYDINKVDSVRVISSGRLPNNPSCVVKQVFKVDELVSRAGRNYILNIGSFIGGQLELDPEDMKRKADVNIGRQSSYNYDIEIQLPEGYYVESVDALNYNIVNDMGEFTAKASIDGDIIKVVTNKRYKTIYSTKDNWNDYIAFLEAAFEFSQKKLIIKKKK